MTTTSPRPAAPQTGPGGFWHLLRAEWTKFRTVRGWVLAMAAVVPATLLLGLLYAEGNQVSCSQGPVEIDCPAPPRGPDGRAVRDKFYFVHQSLTGDGAITVRVASMTGVTTGRSPGNAEPVPGGMPWAKAGVIVKESTRQGSSYAAVMVTGGHGVRMQHDYVHDVAGSRGGAPRWLRLVRSGDMLTGHESGDGVHWTTVGTARLDGLPDTVQVGLFVTSPGHLTVERGDLGGVSSQVRFTEATAVFDHVELQGAAPDGRWSRTDVGADPGDGPDGTHHPGGITESGGTFTVTGNGDIAPLGAGEGQTVERVLTGAATGLILVIVVAATFVTAEYRRGLIRTTLLAGPRRGRVLAAKAVVIGLVAFAAGLAAACLTIPPATAALRDNGVYILPVPALTTARVIVGTAALFAVTAVLALALGALLRRGTAAVSAVVAVLVVPHVLATASLLPDGAARWLLRVTPAAGFSIWQSLPQYPQVDGHYTPGEGYYPLAPWAGFAVLCGYAALALGLAAVRLRRRDA